MEQKITDHLVSKYSPVLVLLFGSRARGDSTEMSDWDFLLITEQPVVVSEKEIFGELIDCEVISVPVNAESLVKKYDSALLGAKILFDRNGYGQDVLADLEKIYAIPKVLEEKDITERKYFLKRKLRKLEVSLTNDGVFFFELGFVYEKAIQYWFELKHRRFKLHPKLALPEIEKEDTEYFNLLQKLYSQQTNQEKLDAAREIQKQYIV